MEVGLEVRASDDSRHDSLIDSEGEEIGSRAFISGRTGLSSLCVPLDPDTHLIVTELLDE